MGFSASQVEGDLVLIDFIDVLNNEPTIIESIALPTHKALLLSNALKDAIEAHVDANKQEI